MMPELTMVTFKQWDDILNQPDIQTRLPYAALIQHFAKGMAYANTNQVNRARGSLTKLQSLLYEKDLAVVFSPFNAPITSANIAKYILMGTIAEKQNNISAAIDYYNMAVTTEDSLVYNEPRDWLIHTRPFLGNVLLKTNKSKEAEKVFRADLKVQPNNYISTKGLQTALLQQKVSSAIK